MARVSSCGNKRETRVSHKATNWVLALRGLKPAPKMLLFYLADRHNPDYGCFPMQATLSIDTEMSVASINTHLNALEDAGLIRRVKRVDRKTGKQLSTRYILGFEEGFIPKPCPDIGDGSDGTTREQLQGDDAPDAEETPLDKPVDNSVGDGKADSKLSPIPTPENAESRLQNLETNPVREPIIEPVKEEEARERDEFGTFFQSLLFAVGFKPGDDLPGWWQGDTARKHVIGWTVDLGLSRDRILDVAENSRHDHPEPPDGPKGLDRAMQKAAREKPRKNAAKEAPKQEDVLAFWSEFINSDKPIMPNSISPSTRHLLLVRKLVTEARLRERGQ